MASSPHRRFLCEDGLLHWREYGPSGAPAVLLLHGLSGSHRWWRRNLPPLMAKYHVYVLEIGGFGSAWRHRAVSLESVTATLNAWLKAENITKAALVGHSMGGQIALRLLLDHPDAGRRIRGVVFVAAAVGLSHSLLQSVAALPQAMWTSHPKFLPTVMFDSLRAGPVNVISSAEKVLQGGRNLQPERLETPALVVWGGRDALVPPAASEAFLKLLPHAESLHFPRAGHVVMYDAAAEFNLGLGRWLDRLFLEEQ